MTNSTAPSYRIAPNGDRFVKLNESWLNTAAIESIGKPATGPVEIRTVSGSVIQVHGVFSVEAFTNGIIGGRFDQPVQS